MFILNINYIKPLKEIEQHLQEHREFLNYFYDTGKFLMSGPKEPRSGGIILCNAKDQKEAFDIISRDPFFVKKVAEYELIEFLPVKTSGELNQYKK